MNQRETLQAIRALGLSATCLHGEYRIAVKGAPATAYFTTDAADAFATAQRMRAAVPKPPPALAPTVAAYFKQRLGTALESKPQPRFEYSPSHPGFTIETGCGCGEECKKAIDAAATLIAHAEAAGTTACVSAKPVLVALAREIVRIYVYG